MDNRSDRNWGSQATTACLFEQLAVQYPSSEIRGLPRSVVQTPMAVTRKLSEVYAPRGAVAADRRGFLYHASMHWVTARWRRDVEWADFIIVNGEGTLHPQKQALRWLPAIAELPSVSSAPVWIVNSSIQFLGSAHEPLFRAGLARVSRIVVREPESQRELETAGFAAELAADCAFGTRRASPDRVAALLESLGIRSRYAVLTGSATAREWPVEYQVRAIHTVRDSGLDVLYASSSTVDDRNYERLARRVSLPVVTDATASYEDFAGILGSAEFLVGGRFHPLIFASLSGTPFVALTSNTHKIAGLMEMLGTGDALCEMHDGDAQQMRIRRLAQRHGKSEALMLRAKSLAERIVINVRQ